MSRKIIINADDFGLCEGVNSAVAKAHTEGVLTSATIMTNTFSSDEAVKLARSMPNLLTDFSPEEHKYEDVVKVYDLNTGQLQLMCDVVSQKVICFFI